MSEGPLRNWEDGDVRRADVEAIGEPGQRRFRLRAIVDGDTYIMWMEKQQLDALGRALDQVLQQLPEQTLMLDSGNAPLEFDLNTRRQFRVGRMELGFDQDRDRLIIIAHDVETDSEDDPGLICRLTRTQARDLSVEAATVVAAGRPRCVLCGEPMQPGQHACPQQNGHLPDALEGTAREAGETE